MFVGLTITRPTRSTLLRSGVVLASVALVAPALSAHASVDRKRKPKPPPPVCKLVVDGSGDATGTGTAVNGSNDPNLDIVSADVATNTKTLTAVVRLASLATGDNTAPTGREYQVVFTVGAVTGSVDAVMSPSGTSFAGGKGKGVIDLKKKEVRISVPLSSLTVPVKPKTKLTAIGARTYRVVGSDQVLLGNVDKADSTSTYIAGTPSCVKVGA
jgi:hypothetical protein